MKKIITLVTVALLMSSCYVSKGLPCPCMHCEKGVKHVPQPQQKTITIKIKR